MIEEAAMRKKIILIATVLLFAVTNFCSRAEPEEEPYTEPTDPQMIDRVAYWRDHPEESPFEEITNTSSIAVVVDATCSVIMEDYQISPDDECKKAIAQCIINRTHAVGFPNTIVEVCKQPYQWQGVTADSQASCETLRLIRQMLSENETAPIPENCVFFVLTGSGIEFRDNWNLERATITLISY